MDNYEYITISLFSGGDATPIPVESVTVLRQRIPRSPDILPINNISGSGSSMSIGGQYSSSSPDNSVSFYRVHFARNYAGDRMYFRPTSSSANGSIYGIWGGSF